MEGAENLENVDILSTGALVKRRGFEQVEYIPWVESVDKQEFTREDRGEFQESPIRGLRRLRFKDLVVYLIHREVKFSDEVDFRYRLTPTASLARVVRHSFEPVTINLIEYAIGRVRERVTIRRREDSGVFKTPANASSSINYQSVNLRGIIIRDGNSEEGLLLGDDSVLNNKYLFGTNKDVTLEGMKYVTLSDGVTIFLKTRAGVGVAPIYINLESGEVRIHGVGSYGNFNVTEIPFNSPKYHREDSIVFYNEHWNPLRVSTYNIRESGIYSNLVDAAVVVGRPITQPEIEVGVFFDRTDYTIRDKKVVSGRYGFVDLQRERDLVTTNIQNYLPTGVGNNRASITTKVSYGVWTEGVEAEGATIDTVKYLGGCDLLRPTPISDFFPVLSSSLKGKAWGDILANTALVDVPGDGLVERAVGPEGKLFRFPREGGKDSVFYQRTNMFEGAGGFIVATVQIKTADRVISSKRDVLFWVIRIYIQDGYDYFLLCPTHHEEYGTGLTKHADQLAFLYQLDPIRLYSYPVFNNYDGHPSDAELMDNRLFYAGRDRVRGSARGLPLKLSNVVPRQMALITPRIKEAILNFADLDVAKADEKALRDLVLIRQPDPFRSSEDYVVWYNYQLTGGSDLPFDILVGEAGTEVNIQWLDKVRGLLIGTDTAEIVGVTGGNAPIIFDGGASNLSLRSPHSFRGSSSSITARGDYALFFVGKDGRTIWYLFYDDGVTGFRSEEGTFLYEFEGDGFVKDMVWSQKNRALYLVWDRGEKIGTELHVMYFSREYEISGWVKWDSLWLTEYISSLFVENDILHILVNPPNEENGKRYLRIYRVREDKVFHDQVGGRMGVHPDRTAYSEIFSRGTHFKASPRGDTGSAAQYLKRAGYTTMLVNGVTEIYFGKGPKSQVYRFKKEEASHPRLIKDISKHVENNPSYLPLLSWEHRKDEEMYILNTSSRIDIMEK